MTAYEDALAALLGALQPLPVETVAVDDPLAVAVQPYAVGGGTSHGQLMQRLLDRLRSGESRQRFEKAGFRPKTP